MEHKILHTRFCGAPRRAPLESETSKALRRLCPFGEGARFCGALRDKQSTMNLTHFFLGLLEGDGSIQVNHWKKRILQFRIVIKLKYTQHNYNMLIKLRDHLKCMKVHVRHNAVLLIENDKKALHKLCILFDKHPFLTQHKRKQYAFFKYCLQNTPTFSEYMGLKSGNIQFPYTINHMDAEQIVASSYYSGWVAGFIEAEGCFCVRKNTTQSFSIGQKNDASIVLSIKYFFGFQNKVQHKKQNMYVLEGSHRHVLGKLIEFLQKYPLLGEKRVSFEKFVQRYNMPKK